ncbi:insulinase family protein [Candidatus Dojkabacteria bacterium]|uniref:Insulinase family protein n=1 Tax=Candidatus Dojkabacteria bacterium TaxID=2099670 RepID=A0A955L7L2_9BACT|nr:insulinase family protein [Candidatus Dojkabacteria bacterium]
MDIALTKLQNGVRVLSVKRQDSMTATVMVLVKVGSRYEDPMHSGIAHFVEHMFFKGTEKRPTSKDIGMAIEKIGGSSNAFTGQDFTGYYIKVPKENFAVSIEILADMIKHGIFQQNEIDKERGVIIEEIRMYEDRPMSKVGSEWYKEYFGDSPLGRDIAGSIDTVSSFNKEHFHDFVNTHYVGDSILVVVSGGVSEQDATGLVKEHFSDVQKGERSKFEKYSREERTPAVKNLYKPIEQSHLLLGGYAHNRNYENRFVLELADAVLSKGFGSRLFQVIRDELGLAYYIYSSITSFEDVGVFKVGMGVENSKVAIAVEAVLKEMRAIISGEFDNDELERAKNYLLGNMVTDMEQSDDNAMWYGLQELLTDKFYTVEDVKNIIMGISKEDIVREMNTVIAGQNLLLASVTPHQSLPDGIADQLHI